MLCIIRGKGYKVFIGHENMKVFFQPFFRDFWKMALQDAEKLFIKKT